MRGRGGEAFDGGVGGPGRTNGPIQTKLGMMTQEDPRNDMIRGVGVVEGAVVLAKADGGAQVAGGRERVRGGLGRGRGGR